MPITQQRLLSIIEAGEHFQATSATLRHFFNLKCREVAASQITIAEAFNQITSEFNLAVPADSTHAATLMAERVRYNITHKRNSIERRRIYNSRHSIPNPPPSTPAKPTPSQVLASVNSRFSGSDDDSDFSPDHLSPETKAAIDREIAKEEPR